MPDSAENDRGPYLDMDGYTRLGKQRHVVDDWLRAEGIIDQDIFYIRFGEGYIEAKCYLRPLVPADHYMGPAWEWRRFEVKALPPLAAHIDGDHETLP